MGRKNRKKTDLSIQIKKVSKAGKTPLDTDLKSQAPQAKPDGAQSFLKHAAPADTSPEKGFFTASDGAQLWFEDTGGPGVPLFFVYGLGCSIQHWKYPRAHFASHGLVPRRQIYLDLRGHGQSPKPARGTDFTLRQTVQDVVDLCRLREVKKAVFLGQSMGGCLLIALADEHPQLVQKAVLLGSPSRSPKHSFPLRSVTGTLWEKIIKANRAAPLTVARVHRSLIQLAQKKPVGLMIREIIRHAGFNPSLSRTTDIEEYISKIMMVDGNTFFQMAGELETFDIKNYQDRIRQPLLVIAGAQDRVIPLSDQLRFKSYLPHAQIEIIPHGSHCPHFDDPKLVNRILENFVQGES